MQSFVDEIEKRRTFAIISHPDAGKTTLTEKLLLYGGAIQAAGMVKGKKSMKHAVSDWMEIEKMCIRDRILAGLNYETGLPNRGVRTNPSLYVLRRTRMPAVLVEMCIRDRRSCCTALA